MTRVFAIPLLAALLHSSTAPAGAAAPSANAVAAAPWIQFLAKPGESFTTPVFTGGCTQNGFGAMSRMFHRYQREYVMRPNKAYRPLPVIYNSWFAVNSLGGNPDDKLMLQIAEEAGKVGIELLVMDSGWENTKGDWTSHPDRFPQGLKPLVDRVHKLAQWMEANPTKVIKDRLALVYAWNEIGEGGRLVPCKDDPDGAYLKTIRRVVLGR